MGTASKKYTITLGAGASLPMLVTGKFFRIIAATGLLDVSGDGLLLEDLTVGDGFEDTPFSRLQFRDKSGAGNQITFVVASESFLNAPQVSTAISQNKNPQVISASHTGPTVASTSGQLLAANTSRSYLCIQNNSATGTIYFRFGATAAVVGAPCYKVGPGGYWEFDSVGMTQAVQCIGDIASNAAVTVVEG